MMILSGLEGAPGSGTWPVIEAKYGNFGVRITGRYYNSNLSVYVCGWDGSSWSEWKIVTTT